jgi:hypothetical protein
MPLSLSLSEFLRSTRDMAAPRSFAFKHSKWPAPYCVLLAVLGAVLLVAAGLKGHQLLTDFRPGGTLFTSRPFQVLTVETELALGLWLLSGIYRKVAGVVAMVYFIGLAAVSGYMVTAGAECCGCLGRLAVSPWFTFGFNLTALCGMALLPVPALARDDFSARPIRGGAALLLFCFAGTYVLAALPTPRLASAAPTSQLGDGELVALDVENWKGKQLPIIDYVDIAHLLETGSWRVVFYHRNCPKCADLLSKLGNDGTLNGTRIAGIHVPPLSGFVLPSTPLNGTRIVNGELAPTKRWVVSTPVVIDLVDGKVVAVEADQR